jgi:hypothetical protein
MHQYREETMRPIFLSVFIFYSFSTFAFWNEVECDYREFSKIITVEIERPHSPQSPFKRMVINVKENNSQSQNFVYTVTSRRFGFNKIQYFGGGVNLIIDLWPDDFPQWGMPYSAELYNHNMMQQPPLNFECRFTSSF